MSQITVDANDVLGKAVLRAAQDYAEKLREIASLEAYVAQLTEENKQLKAELDGRK